VDIAPEHHQTAVEADLDARRVVDMPGEPALCSSNDVPIRQITVSTEANVATTAIREPALYPRVHLDPAHRVVVIPDPFGLAHPPDHQVQEMRPEVHQDAVSAGP
jgi:hypothetical protein